MTEEFIAAGFVHYKTAEGPASARTHHMSAGPCLPLCRVAAQGAAAEGLPPQRQVALPDHLCEYWQSSPVRNQIASELSC